MFANTKLSAEQKHWLNVEFKKDFPNADFFDNERVTLCIIPEFNNSKMVRVSVSIMSNNENKFRRKVGKYFAATRMLGQQYILLPRYMDYLEFMDTITM